MEDISIFLIICIHFSPVFLIYNTLLISKFMKQIQYSLKKKNNKMLSFFSLYYQGIWILFELNWCVVGHASYWTFYKKKYFLFEIWNMICSPQFSCTFVLSFLFCSFITKISDQFKNYCIILDIVLSLQIRKRSVRSKIVIELSSNRLYVSLESDYNALL